MRGKWYSAIQGLENTMFADTLPPEQAESYIKIDSPSFNWALGGGFRPGKIATIFGPESSGKSLIAFLAAASVHKNDPEALVVWYDAEFSYDDQKYAASLGVDNSRVILVKSNKPSGIFDHFCEKIFPLIQEYELPVKLVVIDSLKAIQGPKEAGLKSVEDHVMGDLSSVLPKAFKRWAEPIKRNKIAAICIQQSTMEMDPMSAKYYGKYTLPGGMGLKHASDYIVFLEKIKRKDEKVFDETHKDIRGTNIQIGHRVRVKVMKNKTASPHREAAFTITYGNGVVDVGREVAELGVGLGIVQNPAKGSYIFEDVKVRGIANFIKAVSEDKTLQDKIMKRIYSENPAQKKVEEVEDA